MVKDIARRIVATFVATALGVIGTGAVVGVQTWQAALMAGVGGVATVLERLSRAYLDDGKITKDEVNAAFNLQNPDGSVVETPATAADIVKSVEDTVVAEAPALIEDFAKSVSKPSK
jgi:phage host-nuclease inhibitor protein Gam